MREQLNDNRGQRYEDARKVLCEAAGLLQPGGPAGEQRHRIDRFYAKRAEGK